MVVPIVLLLIGLALVVAEVFFVSMGLLGLMAGTCILAADILAFEQGQAEGWTLVALQLVLVPLLVWGAFRVLPRLPFGRRMLLRGPVTDPGGGFQSLDHLAGREGQALTDLRPAGTAILGDERVTVVAVGGLIPKGSDVVVTAVEGPEVRVRATRTPDKE